VFAVYLAIRPRYAYNINVKITVVSCMKHGRRHRVADRVRTIRVTITLRHSGSSLRLYRLSVFSTTFAGEPVRIRHRARRNHAGRRRNYRSAVPPVLVGHVQRGIRVVVGLVPLALR